jgi:hypothetical protein
MNKKFFIHIPKNAGMTIRKSPVLKNKIITATEKTHKKGHADKVKSLMKKLGDHHGLEHARFRDIDTKYQKEYTFFAVVRNPWDRVVSRYFFAKKVIEVEKKVPSSYADVSSFENFLEERYKWGNKSYMWHRAVRGWFPAFEHVSDENENIKCDIIRFEHLNDELCKYFNIPEMSRARNVTSLNTKSYRDLYTPKTIQIVADWYYKDIETFGFDFDTSATKNYYYFHEKS